MDKEAGTMTLNAARAREQLAEALNRVGFGKERVVIERHGKPVAALVPIEDLETLRALEDRIDLEAARAALKKPDKRSWAEVKAALGF
jgi:prevent-host-death family protein